jgi:signal peptidase I
VAAPEESPATAHSSRRALFEWTAIIGVAVIVTLIVRAFLFEAYYIPSGSMESTLNPGDRVLVDKLSYKLHSVHRGDIVVFSRPPTETNVAIKDLIKRVIGLPGDTIQSGPNGEILIDGKPIAQPWLSRSAQTNPGPPVPRQVLAHNMFYVMGDNRGDSADSRYIGPISGNLIVGRAVLRVWPITGIELF